MESAFIRADTEDLSSSSNLFDLVLSINVLRLLRNPKRALKIIPSPKEVCNNPIAYASYAIRKFRESYA
jgi:2-polyprenyl-3-methyl-5-hydroxy-6-metoxy-1,4-benzoquinol methylase